MRLTIKTNFPDVQKALNDIGPKVKSAIREALNRTAEWAETDVRREMRKVFDRPVPYTLRSLRVFYAKTSNLAATLWFKQRSADRDKQWASAQIAGGQRDLKPMELRLQRIGILPSGWYVVPGGGADLNGYGNMSPGEISRILNVLGAYTEAGYNKANDKTRARLRRGTKRAYGFEYWVNHPLRMQSHLPPGVYKRIYTSFGTTLKPMLVFVKGAKYRKRLRFNEIVTATTAKRFPAEFDKAVRSLITTGSASAFRKAGLL